MVLVPIAPIGQAPLAGQDVLAIGEVQQGQSQHAACWLLQPSSLYALAGEHCGVIDHVFEGGRGGIVEENVGESFTLQDCSDRSLKFGFAKLSATQAQEHLERLCSEVGGFHHQLAAVCQPHSCNADIDLHSLRNGNCLQTWARDQAELKLPASCRGT